MFFIDIGLLCLLTVLSQETSPSIFLFRNIALGVVALGSWQETESASEGLNEESVMRGPLPPLWAGSQEQGGWSSIQDKQPREAVAILGTKR